MPFTRDYLETDWNAAYSWGEGRHNRNTGDSQVKNVNFLNLNFRFIKSLLINVECLNDAPIKFMLLDVGQVQTDAPIATFEFDIIRLIYGYCYP